MPPTGRIRRLGGEPASIQNPRRLQGVFAAWPLVALVILPPRVAALVTRLMLPRR